MREIIYYQEQLGNLPEGSKIRFVAPVSPGYSSKVHSHYTKKDGVWRFAWTYRGEEKLGQFPYHDEDFEISEPSEMGTMDSLLVVLSE